MHLLSFWCLRWRTQQHLSSFSCRLRHGTARNERNVRLMHHRGLKVLDGDADWTAFRSQGQMDAVRSGQISTDWKAWNVDATIAALGSASLELVMQGDVGEGVVQCGWLHRQGSVLKFNWHKWVCPSECRCGSLEHVLYCSSPRYWTRPVPHHFSREERCVQSEAELLLRIWN